MKTGTKVYRVRAKDIPHDTRVEMSNWADNFVSPEMRMDGKEFEVVQLLTNWDGELVRGWFQGNTRENDYFYHESWLDFIEE